MENTAPKDPNVPVEPVTSEPETPNFPPQTPPVSTSSATPGVPTPIVSTPAESTTPPPASAVQTDPVSDTPPKKSSKLLFVVLCLLIASVITVGAIYFILLQKGNKTGSNNTSLNQTAVENPTPPPPTATPAPDNSNAGLEQQNQAVTTDLNNLDTQLNQVNSALSDQQTNLQ